MKNEERAREILIELLGIGLLRIRAFGNAGNAGACRIEADHLHNIPALLKTFRWEMLRFYCNVERSAFMKELTTDVEEYANLWTELDGLVGEEGM